MRGLPSLTVSRGYFKPISDVLQTNSNSLIEIKIQVLIIIIILCVTCKACFL